MLALLTLAVMGATLEWGARAYLRAKKGYDGRHLYQFTFDPYKNIANTPGFVDTRGVANNLAGFRRSTEVAPEKPAGVFRIFLMGASTAYGLGGLWPHIDDRYPVLKNSETIDAYLESALTAAFPGQSFEVINAAVTSTQTHHNLIYLNQTILKYDPDMVIFLDGFNDYFYFDEGHDQFADYTYTLPSLVILGEPNVYSLAYANGWWLFRKSAFIHILAMGARNLRLALKGKGPRHPIDVARAARVHEQVFRANALKMEERCGLILQREGVIPVFALQPLLILERNRGGMVGTERELFEFNVSSYLPNYEPLMHLAVGTVRRAMPAMATSVGGEFIDLTTIFDDTQGQVFTDYAHLTPLGNRIVADTLAGRIVPLVKQRMGTVH